MTSPFGNAYSIDAHRFAIYIPERNRLAEPVQNIDYWVREAAYVLTTITGGATRMAQATGMWLSKDQSLLIEEPTHIVYTFFDPQEFLASIELVRDFIFRFGRETN